MSACAWGFFYMCVCVSLFVYVCVFVFFLSVCSLTHTHSPLCLREHHQSQPPCRSTQLHTQASKKTPSKSSLCVSQGQHFFFFVAFTRGRGLQWSVRTRYITVYYSLNKKKKKKSCCVGLFFHSALEFSLSKTRFQELSGFVVCTVLNAVMGFSDARRRQYTAEGK